MTYHTSPNLPNLCVLASQCTLDTYEIKICNRIKNGTAHTLHVNTHRRCKTPRFQSPHVADIGLVSAHLSASGAHRHPWLDWLITAWHLEKQRGLLRPARLLQLRTSTGIRAPGGVRLSSPGRQGPRARQRRRDCPLVPAHMQKPTKLLPPKCEILRARVYRRSGRRRARGAVSVAFGIDSLTCPEIALESSGSRRKGRRAKKIAQVHKGQDFTFRKSGI
jgi:hypothetical protein